MRAAVVSSPGKLEVHSLPSPVVGDYQCLCEMLYGATCTGTDQHIIGGRFPFPIAYPTILGHESVGRVVKTGNRVRHFQEGQIITRVGAPAQPERSLHSHWGGYSQFGIAVDHQAMREDGLPAPSWEAHRINQIIPPAIDPRAATMMITWRETFSYLRRMGVGPGHHIAIIGSGGNGLAFAAHAFNLGAANIVMLGSASRVEAASQTGVEQYFDYRSAEDEKRLIETNGGKIDFIIDAVGDSVQLNRHLGLLRNGGTLGVYGIDEFEGYGINPWNASSSFRIYQGGYDEAEAHEAVVGFILQGRLQADIWLDLERPYLLEKIASAFDALRAKSHIKALVQLSP